MDLQPIIAKIVADTRQFDKPMQNTIRVMQRFNKKGEAIGSTVRVTAKEMIKAGKEVDSFRLAMTRLSRDIKVAGTILNTLQRGITEAYQAASEGAKIMAAQAFFENAGKSIQEYRKATRGMVSDAELMKKANLADSMGIDEATFKQLVLVAEAAALKTGQSFDYMFNSIITGTARSSRLLLDNLGIIVSVKQANQQYADSIGKTVKQLTAEEKQLAFVNEVRRKSMGMIDEYNQVTDKTAETFARFDSNVQNLADSLKIKLAQAFALVLPAINSILSDMNSMIANQDWSALGEYVALKFLQGFAAMFGKAESFMPLGLIGQALGVDLTVMGNIADEIGEYAQGIRDRSGAKAGAAGQSARWLADDRKEELVTVFGDQWQQKVKDFVSSGTTGMGTVADSMVKGFLEANRAAGQFFGTFVTKAKSLTEKDKPEASWDDPGGSWDKYLQDQTEADDRELAKYKTPAEELQKAMKAFNKEQLDRSNQLGKDMRRSLSAQDKAAKSAERAAKAAEKAARELAATLVGNVAQGLVEGDGLFGPAGAAVGPTVGAAIGGPIGGAIGALLPVIGQILDSLQPVVDFIAAFGNGVKLLIGNALTPLLETLGYLATPIQALLGAVGMLIRTILGNSGVVWIFQTLGKVVAAAITGLAGLFQIAVIFMNAIVGLSRGFLFSNERLERLATALMDASMALEDFTYGMMEALANFNNGLVKFIRTLPGMKDFGELMFASQFGLLDETDDATEDNTDAVEANTQALRDFAREFHNLPQSYNVAGTIAASADPEAPFAGRRLSRGAVDQIGISGPRRFANVRDRL